MKAMTLTKIAPISRDSQPLEPAELPVPEPAAHEVLIKSKSSHCLGIPVRSSQAKRTE